MWDLLTNNDAHSSAWNGCLWHDVVVDDGKGEALDSVEILRDEERVEGVTDVVHGGHLKAATISGNFDLMADGCIPCGKASTWKLKQSVM